MLALNSLWQHLKWADIMIFAYSSRKWLHKRKKTKIQASQKGVWMAYGVSRSVLERGGARWETYRTPRRRS